MRTFNCACDYHHCGNVASPNTNPCLVRVRQLPILYYNSHKKAVPHTTFVCDGLVVVHKPPGWEVGTQQNGVVNDLCTWLQSVVLVMSRPFEYDKEHEHGLAHRLDAICSGLLLASLAVDVGALLK